MYHLLPDEQRMV